MKLIKTAAAGLVVAFALAIPAAASATNETVTSSFDLEPRSGTTFFNNAFKSADWSVKSTVSTPDPSILPMKVADLGFPDNSEMTFNPKSSMPVCPDSLIGPPPVDVSQPVPNIVDRCADSVIGNGTAEFALAKSTALLRDGVMVVFNGGKENGQPRVKVYAYSYDTEVGIYTEATLTNGGRLKFDIPQLTADSAVTQLNLDIPSTNITLENWGPAAQTVVLPAGKDKDYVQAKCMNSPWPYNAVFSLGERDTEGVPTGPTIDFPVSGETACNAVAAKAKVKLQSVKGPKTIKRGKKGVYKAKIKNTGKATAKSVKLKVTGKGIAVRTNVGNIAGGKSKTVRVKAKPKKKGKIKAQFKVTSKNAGSDRKKITIRVK